MNFCRTIKILLRRVSFTIKSDLALKFFMKLNISFWMVPCEAKWKDQTEEKYIFQVLTFKADESIVTSSIETDVQIQFCPEVIWSEITAVFTCLHGALQQQEGKKRICLNEVLLPPSSLPSPLLIKHKFRGLDVEKLVFSFVTLDIQFTVATSGL